MKQQNIVVGAVIEENLYKQFRDKLPVNVTIAEAITWFVWQIATDQMHIEKDEGK